jgi:type IV secretory pathway VirB4 component
MTEEKEAIISSFQKFLNSLDFPTQILMNTEGIEINDYLSALESRSNKEKFGNILSGYEDFLKETINNKKIMNRVFYLVIPEQSDIKIQVDVCLERLSALNLRSVRLKTNEIHILISKMFPESQEICLKNNIGYLKINEQFQRVIYASGYPRNVEAGFLDRIVSLLGDFNLSLHIKPYPIETMLVDINRELQKQRSDLYSMKLKGIINPSLEIQHSDTEHILSVLQKGEERLFNISLYITCKANSIEDLDMLTKKVEAELNSIMILPRVALFRMIQGFRSTAPLGVDELKSNRNITTSALSAFFPFTSQFLQADNSGVWLGLNKNNIPIIKDIFKLSNPNGVVLAQSGGGKSYFCKLLITRYLLNNTKVIIIDPQGEYKGLVNRFNGQIIDLSRDSQTLINPLDLMGHDYTEKRLSLMDLMPVMLGDLSEPQKAFLDKAITETYRTKGITMQKDTWSNKPPILEDLLFELQKLSRKATQIEQATLRSVINRLEMYISGVFSFLNRPTNIEFDRGLVCFDIGNMPKQIKPVVMFLVLDYVYMKMKSDIDRKILLIDEAWSLLSRTEDASYILEIVKTCRKFNMGLLLINQEVEDLFNSRAGKSVLANSAYTMLLRQRPSVMKNICDAFHLSHTEKEHLLTASIGEGLLIMEDDHSKIKVIASPEEHAIITTNADELLVQKTVVKKENKRQPEVNVNLDKRFYKRKELNQDEIKFLLSQGYKEFSQKSIVSGKKENYILNPRHNESLNHMFMVYDVQQFLEKKGVKTEIYTTRMPDLMFNIHGKRYAIEVETGTVLRNLKQMREKINQLNEITDEWFFLVTNKRIVQKYRTYGKTIDPRFLGNFLEKLIKSPPKK